ncbi:MauE/DoxX family redox-associated membrane protein [Nonomuraea sp. NPDC005983]|uniref:MauE/DoxX family redox-associated membrane protein n=1 Tax=Nonomuraea sp. NPDC005983 TaxID=3155595 RepID=UPI0033A06318
MDYVRIGCACLAGLVFAVTAVSKLRDFDGFAQSLPALVPVPRRARRPLAALVVALEALVPILVAVPAATPYGLALAGGLLVAFTAAIAVALGRGQHAPCRCFGVSAAPLGARHLVRNSLLIAAASLGALLPDGSPALAGTALALGAGLIGAILIVSFDDIVDLFARNT